MVVSLSDYLYKVGGVWEQQQNKAMLCQPSPVTVTFDRKRVATDRKLTLKAHEDTKEVLL